VRPPVLDLIAYSNLRQAGGHSQQQSDRPNRPSPASNEAKKKMNKQQGKETTKTKQWQNNRAPPTTIPTATPTAGPTLAPTSLPSAKPTSQLSSISCAFEQSKSKSAATPHSPPKPWKRKDATWSNNRTKKPEQH